MQKIDINCDMGESTDLWTYRIENDTALLPYITSANIACGFHAGDAHTMHELVDAALLAGVVVGAHPGFQDRENFGRTNLQMPPAQIYDLVICQLGALNGFLKINGTKLHHVKAHGALYNMSAKDPVMAMAVCQAVKDYDAQLILFGLSGSELIKTAASIQLKSCAEVFADRTYQDDGSLTPRSAANALIENSAQCLQQVVHMAKYGKVKTITGKTISVDASTVCVHSDGAHALAFAKLIHQALQDTGIEIKPV